MVVSWVNPHDIYAINRGRDFDATALKSARLPENLHDDLRQKPFPQRLFLEADQGKKPFEVTGRKTGNVTLPFIGG